MATGAFTGLGRVAVACVLLAAVAACSAGAGSAAPGARAATAGQTATRGPAACPAGEAGGAALAAASAHARAGAPLIRRGATSAVICQYSLAPSAKTAGLLPLITLSGMAADGLAALLDDARLAASAPRCDGFPFSQVIVFRYRSGPAVTASVRFGVCSPDSGVVTAGGRTAVFGSPFEDALFFYTTLRTGSGGPAAPDVVGLGPAAAAAAASRHGFQLLVDGAAHDGAVPLGTVIFQSLPPGAADSGPGTQLEVILAVPSAPACFPGQLALNYRGGGAGAGNDFGEIIFRDTAQQPCTLAGAVSATGLNAAGGPVTATVTSAFAGPGVLSPHAAPVPAGGSPAPGELAYGWVLEAEYRDGPETVDNGICQPDWVIPASWRVTLPAGATIVIPNADRHDLAQMTSGGGLVTCLGRLGAAGQPSYLPS
jgi:hypothetical protein